MNIRAVIFDLDGTLIDTAPDLANATNHVLARCGRRAVGLDEVRVLVGHGARALIARGFAATGEPVEASDLERLYGEFVAHYEANIALDSQLFPGTVELLVRCRLRRAEARRVHQQARAALQKAHRGHGRRLLFRRHRRIGHARHLQAGRQALSGDVATARRQRRRKHLHRRQRDRCADGAGGRACR